MRTVAQQYSLQAPSRDALGMRLLQGGRTVSKPIPVARSVAPVEFFKGARNVVAPPVAWFLGNGNGLSGVSANPLNGLQGLRGLGALGAVGATLPLNFQHVWSMEDLTGSSVRSANWRKENAQYNKLNFTPVSTTTIDLAKAAWKDMAAIASGTSGLAITLQSKLEAWANALAANAAEVDATWDGVVAFFSSRDIAIEQRRVGALETIKNTLNEIIADGKVFKAQAIAAKDAQDAEIRRLTGQGSNTTGGQANGSTLSPYQNNVNTQDLLAAYYGGGPVQSQQPATSSDMSSKLPFIVMGVAVVLAGGIVLMRRKS